MIRGLLMAGGMSETTANQIGYSPEVQSLDVVVKKKARRKVSAWAKYLKTEMPKLKRKFPRSKPQQLMKKAARQWKKSTKNPNRKRARR